MSNIEHWREKCYADVPVHLYRDLQEFRSRHPYKRLTIDGHEWRYIATDGGSKVLLMLHGSTVSGESNWREIRRFSAQYRVLSPSFPPVESPEMLLEGVRTILDAEHVECASVVGASMGAAIAHWFVRRYPQRVRELVLISLGMLNAASAKALSAAARTFSLVPSPLLRRLMVREAAKLVSALPADEAALMAAYFRDLYHNDMNKRTMIGHFKLVANIATRLSDLGLDRPLDSHHPVLIINADDDETFGREAQDALLATYPHARAHRFSSGGHTLFAQQEPLWTLVSEFIQ